MRNPVLKLLRPRQFAGEDKTVQAGLVDRSYIPVLATVVKRDGSFIIFVYVSRQRIPGIAISQCLGHILADKPRFVVEFNCPYPPEGRVLKYF